MLTAAGPSSSLPWKVSSSASKSPILNLSSDLLFLSNSTLCSLRNSKVSSSSALMPLSLPTATAERNTALSGLSAATPLLISSGSQLAGKSIEAIAKSSLGSFTVLANAGVAAMNDSAVAHTIYFAMVEIIIGRERSTPHTSARPFLNENAGYWPLQSQLTTSSYAQNTQSAYNCSVVREGRLGNQDLG